MLGRLHRPFQTLIRPSAIVILTLLLGTLAVTPARAQSITIDPATVVEAAANTVTWSHTVGSGSNRFLLVSIAIERDTDRVTSATYAGQPMAFVGTSFDADRYSRIEVWRLTAPNAGANTVSVTFTGSASVVAAAISFGNVDQSSPISATQFTSGINSISASASVSSAANEVVLAALAANDAAGTVAAGSGQISRWNLLNAADVIGAGSTKVGSASATMSYTLQTNSDWAMGLLSIRPAPPSGVVTNTSDSGAGSLRAAIDWANANPGADIISFAIPGAGPHTINVSSALPVLTDNGTQIDGTTQSGTQCRDLWAGNGHDLRVNVRGNGGFDGFRLNGANQIVKGLSVTGFVNAVVLQSASNNAAVQCNYLGLFANGSIGANTWGVAVYGASARIGGISAGEGNMISANSTAGIITIGGSTDTAIRGNFIGTDVAGMNARGNGVGINNFIGGATWRDITYNLISANNGGAEIVLEADDRITPSNGVIRIQRNRIGFNRTLAGLLRATGDGIAFQTGSITGALIGGNAATEGNMISGQDDAIDLSGVSNISIKGNTIARANARGIGLSSVSNVTIGGNAGAEGNSIGGNGTDGINISGGSSYVTILGNLIQPVTITGATYPNTSEGIWINGASDIAIGDGTAAGRNVIGGNGRRAIRVNNSITNLAINGNYIGTDATGNVAVTNGESENGGIMDAIAFGGFAANTVSIRNNVIGGYRAALIELWTGSSSGMTIQGNNLGVGADGASQIVSGNAEELILVAGGGTHSNVLIGGSTPGQGNLVGFSATSGVWLETNGTNIQVIGNTIRNNARNGINIFGDTRAAIISNRIFANGMTGIDLAADGVTPNDANDSDTGANDRLNFPQIASISVAGANQLGYSFTLDAPAAANGYRVEFFANTSADPTGFGEGERYLGFVDIVHSGGMQTFSGTITTSLPINVGDIVSTTTTRRAFGGTWDITSEFSATASAGGIAQLSASMTSAVYDPPVQNPYATPTNDIVLTTTISNVGTGSTDANAIFAAVSIDARNSFFNETTAAFGGVVGYSTTAPALTFTPGTDLRFSNATALPTSLAQCTYTPTSGYDPQVRYVCLNPKGVLPAGTQLTVRMRAVIG